MRERFNLLISNLKRVLSNDDLAYKMYMILAVLTFVLVGVFGIIPSSKTLISNVKLVVDLNKNNIMLSNKLAELKKVENELSVVTNNIFFLENYLPTEFNIQDYIVDFVFATGEAEFALDRITPVKEGTSGVDLAVVIVGSGDPVRLISILESLNRVTEIQDLRISKSGEYATLSMLVRTFIMEKQ
ncbi:MAG: hypothetical protein WAX66_02005 [Patescibacteria group bacterium]